MKKIIKEVFTWDLEVCFSQEVFQWSNLTSSKQNKKTKKNKLKLNLLNQIILQLKFKFNYDVKR